MKRKILALIAAVCAAASLVAFAACTADSDNENLKVGGEVTFEVSAVFTASSDVMTLTRDTSVKDYLDALAAKGEISYEGTEGGYGFYITSVNGISEQISTSDGKTSGYSWMIYTDFLEEDGVTYADPAYGTYVYGEKTLASSSYGVSYLPCAQGYTYALVYQAWSY